MPTNRAGVAALLATCLVLGACGATPDDPARSASPDPSSTAGDGRAMSGVCGDIGDGHDLTLHGPAKSRVESEVAGNGPDVVVFLHEKGMTGMCGFAFFADWLATKHHVRSILFDFCGYGSTSCPGNPKKTRPWKLAASAVDWARRHGAHRVTLVGASAGGGDALVAGATIHPSVDAVVDLSGDDGDGAHMLQAARNLRTRVLYATAPHDSFSPVRAMRNLLAATRSGDKALLVARRTPSAHGWDLLLDADGTKWSPVARRIADIATGR